MSAKEGRTGGVEGERAGEGGAKDLARLLNRDLTPWRAGEWKAAVSQRRTAARRGERVGEFCSDELLHTPRRGWQGIGPDEDACVAVKVMDGGIRCGLGDRGETGSGEKGTDEKEEKSILSMWDERKASPDGLAGILSGFKGTDLARRVELSRSGLLHPSAATRRPPGRWDEERCRGMAIGVASADGLRNRGDASLRCRKFSFSFRKAIPTPAALPQPQLSLHSGG